MAAREKTSFLIGIVLVLLLFSGGCSTYSSVSSRGRHVFVVGNTSFLGITSSWIKRCDDYASELRCIKVMVKDVERISSPGPVRMNGRHGRRN